jgi:hypothetical protein
MNVQTCMAGRSIPIRKLIQDILTSRGHLIGEAPNPARCVDWYTNGPNSKCNLMVVEYTGPETLDMIDILIERRHVQPGNIAVLTTKNSKGAQEAQDYGCYLLAHPFRMEEFIAWALSGENRCRMKAA